MAERAVLNGPRRSIARSFLCSRWGRPRGERPRIPIKSFGIWAADKLSGVGFQNLKGHRLRLARHRLQVRDVRPRSSPTSVPEWVFAVYGILSPAAFSARPSYPTDFPRAQVIISVNDFPEPRCLWPRTRSISPQ